MANQTTPEVTKDEQLSARKDTMPQHDGATQPKDGMNQAELQKQQAQDLPDREEMSLVEVGDINLDATVVAPINADIDALVNAPINADVDANVGVDVDALVNAPIDATVYAPINADVDVPVNVGGEQTITYNGG